MVKDMMRKDVNGSALLGGVLTIQLQYLSECPQRIAIVWKK